MNLTTILYNNPEWGIAFNPAIELSNDLEYFTINNSAQNIDNINPGDVFLNFETPFEIIVDTDTPEGSYDFELVITSNNTEYATYNSTSTITIDVRNTLSNENFMADIFSISSPYPNPFNPSTELNFDLEKNTHVKIDIYNLNGEVVETLEDSFLLSGSHFYKWEPTGLANGIYFINYFKNNNIHTQKITLLK